MAIYLLAILLLEDLKHIARVGEDDLGRLIKASIMKLIDRVDQIRSRMVRYDCHEEIGRLACDVKAENKHQAEIFKLNEMHHEEVTMSLL